MGTTYNLSTDTFPQHISNGDILDIPFTNQSIDFMLKPGVYRFKLYGAEGQSIGTNAAGKGGYSEGRISLLTNTHLYCYVGGTNGYNGGGTNQGTGGNGGGATDIRIGQDSLYSRVIVAGGGGGAGSNSSGQQIGGSGGGITGSDGIDIETYPGTAGTQIAGGTSPTIYDTSTQSAVSGSFGFGGDAPYNITDLSDGGSGGGGWYGGSGGGAGAGGSGYVYTQETSLDYPQGCLLNSNFYLSDAFTANADNEFPDLTDLATEKGHSGNGYIRIICECNGHMIIKLGNTFVPIHPELLKAKVNNDLKQIKSIWVKNSSIWMKAIEALTYDEGESSGQNRVVLSLVSDNYAPNGEKFSSSIAAFDVSAGDYVEISIDISTCTGVKEDIIGFAQTAAALTQWAATNTCHFYYTRSTQELSIGYYDNAIGGTQSAIQKRHISTYSGQNPMIIKLDIDGIWLNGVLTVPTESVDLSTAKINLGSVEGSSRSHAVYNYIRYYKYISEEYEVLKGDVTDYNANEKKFLRYLEDFNSANGDYIEASIDYSNCVHEKEELIGFAKTMDNLSVWGANHTIHVYFTKSIKQLSIGFVEDGVSDKFHRQTYTGSNPMIIRLDANGLSINGVVKAAVQTNCNLTEAPLYLGSCEGVNRSNAKYNYIKYVKGS